MLSCNAHAAQGDLNDEEQFGVIPRATRQIFEYISNAPQEVTFSLSVPPRPIRLVWLFLRTR